MLEVTAPSDFVELPFAWCGRLLGNGNCFQRVSDGKYFMSLGFKAWAVLLWEMQQHIFDGAALGVFV